MIKGGGGARGRGRAVQTTLNILPMQCYLFFLDFGSDSYRIFDLGGIFNRRLCFLIYKMATNSLTLFLPEGVIYAPATCPLTWVGSVTVGPVSHSRRDAAPTSMQEP